MADLTREHLTVARALGESHTAAVVMAGAVLKELYRTLRLGGGVFRPRGMAEELEAQTLVELWAYLAALLVSMVERWPTGLQPSDLDPILVVLEGMLVDVQGANYRSAYEEYRRRHREGRSSLGVVDSELLGGKYGGLHEEFLVRIALVWMVPSRATIAPIAPSWRVRAADRTQQAFIGVMSDLKDRNSRAGSGRI